MRNQMSYGPGDGCKNIQRPCQQHPNPAPGSSPQAAAAAKNDMKKRANDGIVGVIKAAYKKLTDSAPQPGNPQSAAALADRKDQAAKLKNQ